MQIYRPAALLNVVVISPAGTAVQMRYVQPHTLGLKLKQSAVEAFSATNELHYFAPSMARLARRYALVHVRIAGRLAEKCTLDASGVWNNGERAMVGAMTGQLMHAAARSQTSSIWS